MTEQTSRIEQAPALLSETASVISIIAKAASDPNVDVAKLEKLLDMQERIMAKNAEMAYNTAMAEMQPQFPQIPKTKKAHNSNYAPYDEVDKVIKPVYTKFGFSLSFDSRKEGAETTYYGKCSHKDGFSETKQITLPADTSGAKNAIQAVASTISYAKRYLVGMLFNIVTMDEDNDGNSALPNDLAVEIDTLLRESGANKEKFLEFMKAKNVQEILSKDFVKARNVLENIKKKKGKA